MKFRMDREALADAVAWTARSLPSRPTVPALAGLLLTVDGDTLTVSGFDYEVSARAEMAIDAGDSGAALVSGRLLAEITRSLPAQPVQFATEGTRVVLTCGATRFALPTLPVDDYPVARRRVSEVPLAAAGRVPGVRAGHRQPSGGGRETRRAGGATQQPDPAVVRGRRSRSGGRGRRRRPGY